MSQDTEILRAHIDRLRKGLRAGAFVCPFMFAAAALVQWARGEPMAPAEVTAGVCLSALLWYVNWRLQPESSHAQVLRCAGVVAGFCFIASYTEIGLSGGATSLFINAFVLLLAGCAFFLPLRTPAIILVYPAAVVFFIIVVLLTTPPSAPSAATFYAVSNACWAGVVASLGAWFQQQTLRDAFSWRSALREEARRADLGLERARIARDLHDHIGARLTGIALRAERERRRLGPESHEPLLWIQDTVRMCLEELRDTIWALSNSGRDARELVATLRRRAEDIADAAGLDLIWKIEDDVWNGTLSPGVSVALSAILREALTNTIRHSGAKRVTVALDKLDKVIRMEVSDDGRGLGDKPNEGRGLNNMRTRAKEQNGDVHIEQNANQGLKVVAEIPWREDLLQDQKAA